MEKLTDLHALAERFETGLQFEGTIGLGQGATVEEAAGLIAPRLHADTTWVTASRTDPYHGGTPLHRTDVLNNVAQLDWAIVEAADIDPHGRVILRSESGIARDKILLRTARRICAVTEDGRVSPRLGTREPVPIEVMPVARSYVGRRVASMGCQPAFDEAETTTDGNDILLLRGLDLTDPRHTELALREIPGVIAVGLAAEKPASTLFRAAA